MSKRELRKEKRQAKKAARKEKGNIFKRLKDVVMLKFLETFIVNLLEGWFQKLNPDTYKVVVGITYFIMAGAATPQFRELVGTDVVTWVLELLGLVVLALTGSTPGPNGEIEAKEN